MIYEISDMTGHRREPTNIGLLSFPCADEVATVLFTCLAKGLFMDHDSSSYLMAIITNCELSDVKCPFDVLLCGVHGLNIRGSRHSSDNGRSSSIGHHFPPPERSRAMLRLDMANVDFLVLAQYLTTADQSTSNTVALCRQPTIN